MTARVVGAPVSGWDRLAQAVAQLLPVGEIDGVWVFAPIRRESREWGTAVLSRIDGDRRRIYTARYVLVVKGKERGKFESTVQEVGSGPIEAFSRLVQEAQTRIDDEHPPVQVTPGSWFATILTSDSSRDGAPG